MGEVSIQDYKQYFSYCGGCIAISYVLGISIVNSILQLLTTYSLSNWTNQDADEQKKSIYPGLFAASIGAFVIVTIIRAATLFAIILNGNTRLHQSMSNMVIKANILFFDSNPIGRIVTRFSKDIMLLDAIMP